MHASTTKFCAPNMLQPIKLKIKPLTINQAFTGRRFKTTAYKAYIKHALLLIPAIKLPPAPYVIYLDFGQSSDLTDFDNPVKPFVDVLGAKFKPLGFNDRQIKRAVIQWTPTAIGQEYVCFQLQTLGDESADFYTNKIPLY